MNCGAWRRTLTDGTDMPQLVVLPHVELCPDGAVIDATPGKSICDNLLEHGIEIEHACEKSCACTTCHVVIREGFNDLTPSEEDEDDLLDKAWGLEPTSRLSCQAIVKEDSTWWSRFRSTRSTTRRKTTDRNRRQAMKWTDSREIAIALADKHPDIDPQRINFVDLRQWVLELDGFNDDPTHSGEKILEAIQAHWIDESDFDDED